MNSFTFYKNYYELIKHLKKDDRMQLYDAIMKYMFEDEETQFDGLLNGIWINLKMPLDTSKNNSGRGGRPKKTEKKPIRNRLETDLKSNGNPMETEKKTNNISYFLFLISNFNYKYIKENNNIYNKIKEWLKYKEERKEKYKETGLKNLLKQIENKIEIYGEEKILNLIDECMANNWKGIIFDKLEKTNVKKSKGWEDDYWNE